MSFEFILAESDGVRQRAIIDDGDKPGHTGISICTESTNIRAALDANQRARSVHKQAPRGDQTWGNHVASIPLGVWEGFCRENPELRQWTTDSHVWLLGKLNSGEYCNLKTFDGRV